MDQNNGKKLEDLVGHKFKNPALLLEAITHRSYRNEQPDISIDNERLEFLGDAVLGLVVSTFLWHANPDEDEGSMTRARANLVSETALALCARELGLGSFLFLGKGEESCGGADRDSVLADAMEAVIGAVYVDGGFDAATRVVSRFLKDQLQRRFEKLSRRDPRTELQEFTQRMGYGTPEYEVISESGPTHSPLFQVRVGVSDRFQVIGEGSSKKIASKAAAETALDLLEGEGQVAEESHS